MCADKLDRSVESLIVHELKNHRDLYKHFWLKENWLHFQQDGAPDHYVVPAG